MEHLGKNLADRMIADCAHNQVATGAYCLTMDGVQKALGSLVEQRSHLVGAGSRPCRELYPHDGAGSARYSCVEVEKLWG